MGSECRQGLQREGDGGPGGPAGTVAEAAEKRVEGTGAGGQTQDRSTERLGGRHLIGGQGQTDSRTGGPAGTVLVLRMPPPAHVRLRG